MVDKYSDLLKACLMATLGRSWEQLTTYSALGRHRNSCIHKKNWEACNGVNSTKQTVSPCRVWVTVAILDWIDAILKWHARIKRGDKGGSRLISLDLCIHMNLHIKEIQIVEPYATSKN